MNIQIDPEAQFSTSEASRMLGIDGLTQQRVRLLCEKGEVPYEMSEHAKEHGIKPGGRYGHIRIRFKDFPKIIEAHRKVRTLRAPGSASKNEAFEAKLNDLNDRVAWLEKALFHELGIERVDSETVSS